jgi:hypothetical protein
LMKLPSLSRRISCAKLPSLAAFSGYFAMPSAYRRSGRRAQAVLASKLTIVTILHHCLAHCAGWTGSACQAENCMPYSQLLPLGRDAVGSRRGKDGQVFRHDFD